MGVLLKEGVEFEYVSGSNSGRYKVVMPGTITIPISGLVIKPSPVVFSRRITDGKMIVLNCDDDGYYRGDETLIRIGVIKPVKHIKKFKLC